MTKQEVFNKFYASLTPAERAAGPEGLPDFVTLIRNKQPPSF